MLTHSLYIAHWQVMAVHSCILLINIAIEHFAPSNCANAGMIYIYNISPKTLRRAISTHRRHFLIPERLASIRAVVLAFTAKTNKQTLSISWFLHLAYSCTAVHNTSSRALAHKLYRIHKPELSCMKLTFIWSQFVLCVTVILGYTSCPVAYCNHLHDYSIEMLESHMSILCIRGSRSSNHVIQNSQSPLTWPPTNHVWTPTKLIRFHWLTTYWTWCWTLCTVFYMYICMYICYNESAVCVHSLTCPCIQCH